MSGIFPTQGGKFPARGGKIRLIWKLFLLCVFMLFSGFEFKANLDANQHTGVLALFFGFEFKQVWMLSNIQVFCVIFLF
jgi:hypothetical protein